VDQSAGACAPLSLSEVRESGRPAFFFDYGEALVYWHDELFDLRDWGGALQTGADPAPLPAAVLESEVGIEYGWRHTIACACDLCRQRADDESGEDAIGVAVARRPRPTTG
jgi:hypothetical protein